MSVTGKRTVLALLGIVMFASLASAGIAVSPASSKYSFGDRFEITIDVNPAAATSDFFVAALVCEGSAVEIYRAPLSLGEGEEKEIVISTLLDNFLVRGVDGNCFIRASYGSETVSGNTFEISGNVDVSFDLGGSSFDPGESVSVAGTAVKSNGENLEGIVEILVDGIDFSYAGVVEDGEFNPTFLIPSDALAGSHTVRVVAYEQNEAGETTNVGEKKGVFKINQIVTEVDVALVEETATPDSEFSYSVLVYDQSGAEVSEEATVTVYNSLGEEILKEIVQTTKTKSFFIASNDSAGNWEIHVKVEDVEIVKEFFVEELEKVSFSLEEGVLTVSNVGNVPFKGPVEITIGEVSEIKELELDFGKQKRFKLRAPDGEYNILVNDGGDKSELGTTLLTGSAISVKDVGGALVSNLWILILVVGITVLVVVVFIYRKKKKSWLGRPEEGFFKSSKFGSAERKLGKKIEAGEGFIDRGEKQQSAIVSLHIKNLAELQSSGSDGLKAVDSALWKAKDSGAKIYSDGEYRVIVLAPILTKERDTTLKGLRVAEDLARNLNVFNRRAATKVVFGIGVNYGNLIVESSGGKFKFISLDNIIAITKRISQEAEGNVLVSDKLRRVAAGKVKGTKLGKYWKLDKVTDRSAHVDFVSRFKERQRN